MSAHTLTSSVTVIGSIDHGLRSTDSIVSLFDTEGYLLDHIPASPRVIARGTPSYTARDIHDLILTFTSFLQTSPNQYVLPTVTSHIEFIIVTLAGLMSRKTVLTHPSMLSTIVTDASTATIIDSVSFDAISQRPIDHVDLHPLSECGNVVFLTSGTTATAKAITLSAINIIAGALGLTRDVLLAHESDLALMMLPIHHVYEFEMELMFIMIDVPMIWSTPRDAYTTYMKEHPTLIVTVPEILNRFYESRLPLHVRMIITGGARIRSDVYDYYRGQVDYFINGYGSTETAAAIALSINGGNDRMVCGKANIIKVTDDGELMVKGLSVSNSVAGENGWYYTNDVVKMNDDGTFAVIGRRGCYIKTSRGEYVNVDKLSKVYSSPELYVLISVDDGMVTANIVSGAKGMSDDEVLLRLREIAKAKGLERFEMVEKVCRKK